MEFGSDIFPESRQHCQETKYYCKWCTVLLLKPKLMSPVETPHNVKSSKFDFRFSLVIRCMLSIFPYFQLPQDMGDIWSHWVRSFRAEKWGFHRCSVKNAKFLAENTVFGQKSIFFGNGPIFCLFHDWTPKRQHFCVDPHFLARTDPTQWDHKNPIFPYPGVTLDNFGFPVGGRSAARRDVFRSLGRILAISGQSPIAFISTLNFGPWSTKLGGTIRATLTTDLVLAWITEKTDVFLFCQKVENGQKICFFLPKKHPRSAKRLQFIWEKGTFFFE